MDLGDAAETVRVLDVFLGAVYQFASLEYLHEALAGRNLSAVRAYHMRKRQERLYAAVICIQRHRSYAVGPFGQPDAVEDCPYCVCAHELGAVEQGETLLGLKPDGFPAQFLPDLGGRTDLAFVQHFSQADEWQAEVGERGEVARRAQRALLVDDRQDVFVEHVDQALDSDQLGSGMAIGEALGLEEEHQFDYFRADGRSRAAGVGHHQVVLQLREVSQRDGDVIERAESGGDTVQWTVYVFHLVVQVLAALDHRFGGFVREGDLLTVFEDLLHPLEREASR